MGNVFFDINGNVNLNKNVDWQINKNVVANVEIEDKLATAQADAESFGELAFAETDAFATVNDEFASSYSEAVAGLDSGLGFGPIPPPELNGQINIRGNTNIFTPVEDENGNFTLFINFDAEGGPIPDVDGADGFDELDIFPEPGQTNNIPLPFLNAGTGEALDITGLNLVGVNVDSTTGLGIYESVNDWIADFGERTIDLNQVEGGPPFSVTGNLTLTLPQNAKFALSQGALGLALNFSEFANVGGPFGGAAYFTLDGTTSDGDPFNQDYEAPGFVFSADSLSLSADYSFNASSATF